MEQPVEDSYFHRGHRIAGSLHSALGHHPEGHGYRADEHDAHVGGAFGDNIRLQPKQN